MAIDGLFIHKLIEELKPTIEKAIISKIYQPTSSEIIMQIRNNYLNYQLYFNIGLDNPRVHITYKKYDNPQTPFNFCMLLRKYLERGIIEKIEQIKNDRIIKLTILSYNEMDDQNIFYLYFELMGRSANFILTSSNNIIIDASRKLPPSDSNVRYILPKAKYELPLSNKINPFEASDDTFYETLEGCSKDLLGEFSYCNNFTKVINQPTIPVIYDQPRRLFYCFPLTHLTEEYKTYSSLSEVLDIYFIEAKTTTNYDFIKMGKHLRREINKRIKKLENLCSDLTIAKTHLQDTDYGILLQSYLYQIKPKDTSITVNNFLKDNEEITIDLDPNLDASGNLNHYFKTAKKANHAVEEITKQLALTKEEIEYLETIFYQLEFLSLKELNEVRDELIKYKFLQPKKHQQGHKKSKIQIACYTIDDTEILVGKNNLQNEYLTNKLAKSNDIWFHVKDLPGSHVIVRGNDLSEKIIRFAANIAACFSKAHASSSVPVDYTEVRYLKKIPGVRGYKVTFTHNSTIYIDPDMEKISSIKITYK